MAVVQKFFAFDSHVSSLSCAGRVEKLIGGVRIGQLLLLRFRTQRGQPGIIVPVLHGPLRGAKSILRSAVTGEFHFVREYVGRMVVVTAFGRRAGGARFR